jgi:hypothetical protein
MQIANIEFNYELVFNEPNFTVKLDAPIRSIRSFRHSSHELENGGQLHLRAGCQIVWYNVLYGDLGETGTIIYVDDAVLITLTIPTSAD